MRAPKQDNSFGIRLAGSGSPLVGRFEEAGHGVGVVDAVVVDADLRGKRVGGDLPVRVEWSVSVGQVGAEEDRVVGAAEHEADLSARPALGRDGVAGFVDQHVVAATEQDQVGERSGGCGGP